MAVECHLRIEEHGREGVEIHATVFSLQFFLGNASF